MNIETITMNEKEALSQLRGYQDKLRRGVKARLNDHMRKEYEDAISALKELGKGHAILDIDEVIRNAPVDAKERPRLAIGRADLKQIAITWEGNSTICNLSHAERRYHWQNSVAESLRVSIDMRREHHYQKIASWDTTKTLRPAQLLGFAMVPLIPPKIELKAKPENYHILWEVEEWADTEIGARPDRDPYLLRRINSTLFAVIAEWDLTDLERLVMKHRINND